MATNHPYITYTITFDPKTKVFSLWDDKLQLVAEDTNGRELGRMAWQRGTEVIHYNYDLTVDEGVPLKRR